MTGNDDLADHDPSDAAARFAWMIALAALPASNSIGRPPAFSQDLAQIECYQAYALGLWTCAVLAGYAACEIFLADRLRSHLLLKDIEAFAGNPEAALSETIRADKAVKSFRGINNLLDELRRQGSYVRTSVEENLRALSSEKNNLAHYRPLYEEGTLQFEKSGPSAVQGTMTQSSLTSADARPSYAHHAVATVAHLWEAPVISRSGPHSGGLDAFVDAR